MRKRFLDLTKREGQPASYSKSFEPSIWYYSHIDGADNLIVVGIGVPLEIWE